MHWPDHKPSTATICKNLSHWTVVLIPRDGFNVYRIYTDENDLTAGFQLFWTVIEGVLGCFPGPQALENPYKTLTVQ